MKSRCIWIIGRSGVGKTSLTTDLFPETEMMDIQFSGPFINCDNFKQGVLRINDLDSKNTSLHAFNTIKLILDGDSKIPFNIKNNKINLYCKTLIVTY